MKPERKASRSARRREKQLIKAAEKRQRQLESGDLSLESGLGKLVIVVSSRANYKYLAGRSGYGMERVYFREEAERLAEERASEHQRVAIRPKAVPGDIALDLTDPDVTDMILIGHGNISALWADPDGYFNWREVSRIATHLKQGKIEQRMCGDFTEDINYHVPLGTFVVSQLSNVTAAAGLVVPDRDPPDELFQPVFNDETEVLAQVQALNDRYRGNTRVVHAPA